MVVEELHESGFTVPPSKQCRLANGLYQIRTQKTLSRRLSYPSKNNHKLYFAPLFYRKAGNKQEVKTLRQLVSLLRADLNKRGLLILPKHL